jgi:manganese transport protein
MLAPSLDNPPRPAPGARLTEASLRPLSLGALNGSVHVPEGSGFNRWVKAFAGPGFLVAVGYMDPGNWATDIAGGATAGYTLLSVILLSNLVAMVLQRLAVRLGVIGGMDLAQACRATYSRPVNLFLWGLCELAIIACDVAELVGTAIALKLLFGIPLLTGIVLTGLDVLLVLGLQRFGFRKVEAFILALLLIIAGCFLAMIVFSQPPLGEVMAGLVPSARIVTDPALLYLAVGILGATVMPHNLYLHSAVVQTRDYARTPEGRRKAARIATIDSNVALGFAFFINAAILIVAAAAFHGSGASGVGEIEEAYRLLSPMLGVGAASVLFGVALLCAGQNATVTGTLAGQIVMEGFLSLKMAPWLRRMVTRLIAIVPAIGVVMLFGEGSTTQLLVFSQVVLSLQLPFAVAPLIHLTARRDIMGDDAQRGWPLAASWAICAVIVTLNLTLLGLLVAL